MRCTSVRLLFVLTTGIGADAGGQSVLDTGRRHFVTRYRLGTVLEKRGALPALAAVHRVDRLLSRRAGRLPSAGRTEST